VYFDCLEFVDLKKKNNSSAEENYEFYVVLKIYLGVLLVLENHFIS
jgi:hypothetical protein